MHLHLEQWLVYKLKKPFHCAPPVGMAGKGHSVWQITLPLKTFIGLTLCHLVHKVFWGHWATYWPDWDPEQVKREAWLRSTLVVEQASETELRPLLPNASPFWFVLLSPLNLGEKRNEQTPRETTPLQSPTEAYLRFCFSGTVFWLRWVCTVFLWWCLPSALMLPAISLQAWKCGGRGQELLVVLLLSSPDPPKEKRENLYKNAIWQWAARQMYIFLKNQDFFN